MTRNLKSRGLTLLELLVTTAILSVVVGSAVGVLIGQNATYMRQSGTRGAREQAIVGLDKLEEAIRKAGFGIDPQLAFDFDYYNCKLGSGSGSISQTATCQTLARDSNSAADEMVLYSRNPSYSTNGTTGCAGAANLLGNVWKVIGASATTPSVTLTLKANDIIHRGRVLQIVCDDAATYTYVTVAALATSTACANVQVGLESPITITGPTGTITSPYTRSDLLGNSCFGTGSAKAFLVDRQHFFIHQDTSNPTKPRPYLMLDQGLDIAGPGGTGPDGVLDDNDLIPVAADIEDFQVAYVLDQVGIAQTGVAITPAQYMLDNNANGIWGETPGVQEQLTGNSAATAPYNLSGAFTAANLVLGVGATGAPCFNASLMPFRAPCLFDKATLEVSRANVHPYRWTPWTGNISEVRINLVARSSEASAKTTGQNTGSSDIHYLSALENRPRVDLQAAPGWYGNTNAVNFVHSYFSGAVRTVNAVSSGIFTY